MYCRSEEFKGCAETGIFVGKKYEKKRNLILLAPLSFLVILTLAMTNGFLRLGIFFTTLLLSFGMVALTYFFFTNEKFARKNLWMLLLFMFPALIVSFKFQNPLVFLGVGITMFLCILTLAREYIYLPFVVFLVLVGLNLNNLGPAEGYDGPDHLNYIAAIASGASYEFIDATNYVAYVLPIYYTPPKYLQLATGLPIGRAAQAINFLYAFITAIFLLFILEFLNKISLKTKLIGVCILLSAASVSRLFSYLRSDTLQTTLIVVSIYFLLRSSGRISSPFFYLSLFVAATATIVRFTALFYLAALIPYYLLKSIQNKERFKQALFVTSALIIFVSTPFIFLKQNPFEQNIEEMAPGKYASKAFHWPYLFGFETKIFRSGEVKNYLQAFLNDWWGDWYRYYTKYNNETMWKIHIVLSYIASFFIIIIIGIYILKQKRRPITRLINIDNALFLHLIIALCGMIIVWRKYADLTMDVTKAVYLLQVVPILFYLFINGLHKLKIKNNTLLIVSILFFIQSIYTQLL